jgi:demethylmenaquinone methyltransferase/2-methoxy-6-polyprenyl-1,4-benzoquinol methylase
MTAAGQLAEKLNAAGFEPRRDDVFARIAGRYDLLCDLFSLGMHRMWKRGMARQMSQHPGDVVLDVASGTGDIPMRLVRRGGRPRELWVTDISSGMLDIAERKLKACNVNLQFALRDAEKLSEVSASSVDVYSISFGMKICNRAEVVREAFRVLKPGGYFYCLEAARIPWGWLHRMYLAYMGWCMPLIGRIATGGDASAYLYLLRGVRDFPDQRTFAMELEEAGFAEVSWRNMTFGIVALHVGRKPGWNDSRFGAIKAHG